MEKAGKSLRGKHAHDTATLNSQILLTHTVGTRASALQRGVPLYITSVFDGLCTYRAVEKLRKHHRFENYQLSPLRQGATRREGTHDHLSLHVKRLVYTSRVPAGIAGSEGEARGARGEARVERSNSLPAVHYDQ